MFRSAPRQSRFRLWVVALTLALGTVHGGAQAAGPSGRKQALLIACSRFDHPKFAALNGPENDVRLLADTLQSRYGLDREAIVTLSESAPADYRPLYAHIRREFARLADQAEANDWIVIHFSTHGSRQPDVSITDEQGNEIGLDESDGYDEVILTADSQPAGDALYVNAIVDDELNAWCAAIAAKGAFVWLTVDCCHSGTIARGDVEEAVRRVEPVQVFSSAELQRGAAQARASAGHVGQRARRPLDNLVMLYASAAHEPTSERPYPNDQGELVVHGTLTYTLCQILNEAPDPLTFRELARRIGSRYVSANRWLPMPSMEGTEQDRLVLGGGELIPPAATLSRKAEQWLLSRGQLQGVRPGDVYAVHDKAPVAEGAAPRCYARAREVRLTTTLVEPCDFAGQPAIAALPDEGVCRLAARDYSTGRDALFLDVQTSGDAADRMRAALEEYCRTPDAPYSLTTSLAEAAWELRLASDGAQLLPAVRVESVGNSEEQEHKPLDLAPKNLVADLSRIARAESLRRLAADFQPAGRRPQLDVSLEVLRHNNNPAGEVVPASPDLALISGDKVSFRLINRGQKDACVVLLNVDSRYGIKVIHHEPGDIVRPGQDRTTEVFHVQADPPGLESLIALVLTPQQQTGFDVSFLEQPPLGERDPAVSPKGEKAGGNRNGSFSENPLERLLAATVYSTGRSRGPTPEFDQACIRQLSWKTVPDCPQKGSP